MRHSPTSSTKARLLPEGRRWGFGAHSVMPYLDVLLEARAADAAAATAQEIRNPVFPQMERALRDLIRRH